MRYIRLRGMRFCWDNCIVVVSLTLEVLGSSEEILYRAN